MNKLYLSHSQISTFKECERKWWLDKVMKLRPSYKKTSLFFGGAIDSAIESILLKVDKCPIKVFEDSINKFDINKKKKQLPEDLEVVRFATSDLDHRLVDQELIDEKCKQLEIDPINPKEFLEYCKSKRQMKEELSKVEKNLYQYVGYLSLLEKGRLIVGKLQEWIEENVEEVVSVQQKIEIENENGDKFIGYLDFILKLTSGKTVLIDLKTSSSIKQYYPSDSASKSPQLGVYAQETGIFNVGYLVAEKAIRVREPRVRTAFIEGKITDDFLDEIFEEIEECTNLIKDKISLGEGAFESNKDACWNWGKCQYFNYCKHGDKEGLEIVK